jgi:hypothetical protein
MARLRRFINYADPNSFAMRLRRRRSVHIKALIDQVHREKGSCRILDLGGTDRYWTIFEREYLVSRGCRVLVLNLRQQGESDDIFTFGYGDATDLSEHADRSFDLVHANSVIEHMGSWIAMEAFAREVRRLADRYYVQTPNFWFPLEPHFRMLFLHWLPFALGVKLLKWRAGKGDMDVGRAARLLENNRTLDRTQLRFLFPDALIKTEWLMLMPKSLMAIRGGRD